MTTRTKFYAAGACLTALVVGIGIGSTGSGSTKVVDRTVSVPGPTVSVPGPTVTVPVTHVVYQLPPGCGDAEVAYEKAVNDLEGVEHTAWVDELNGVLGQADVDAQKAALAAIGSADTTAANDCFPSSGSES